MPIDDDVFTLDPQVVNTGRFHCTSDGHNKWWAFSYDPLSRVLLTEWGPLDSSATQDSQKAAQSPKEVERLVNSKLRKGYYEASLAPVTPTWAAALDDEAEENYEVEDLVEWLSQQDGDEFAQSLVKFYDEREFLSPKQLDVAKAMRARAADPVTQEGFYLNPDGDTVRVRRAKAGHFYAVNLDGELITGGMKGLTGSMYIANQASAIRT